MTLPIPEETGEITRLLRGERRSGGEDRFWELVFPKLHRIAQAKMAAEKPGQTIGATALVNETWLRLRASQLKFATSADFIHVARHIMTNILIDRARKKDTQKGGGENRRVPMEAAENTAGLKDCDPVLAVDIERAFEYLRKSDGGRAEKVFLLRWQGFTLEKVGENLGISETSARREMEFARSTLAMRILRESCHR